MIQFLKDGQGYWDFDFDVLEDLTNREFALVVKGTLDEVSKRDFEEILDVQLIENNHFVRVRIYSDSLFYELAFNKSINHFERYVFGYRNLQDILNTSKKLGVFNV